MIVTVVRETHLGAKKIFLRCRGRFSGQAKILGLEGTQATAGKGSVAKME